MRRHILPFVGVLLVCGLFARVALAQAPAFLPTRDVTVTYSVTGIGRAGPSEVRVAVAAGGVRARIDAPDLPGYLLIDRAHGQVSMVLEGPRIYVDVPGAMARTEAYLPDRRARFLRLGVDHIAGYRCTAWQMTGPKGDASGCLTDDGVILRGTELSRDGMVRVVATAVAYGTLPAATFVPPPGFRHLALPPGMSLR